MAQSVQNVSWEEKDEVTAQGLTRAYVTKKYCHIPIGIRVTNTKLDNHEVRRTSAGHQRLALLLLDPVLWNTSSLDAICDSQGYVTIFYPNRL